jgi:zinc transport system substrate-binding protein
MIGFGALLAAQAAQAQSPQVATDIAPVQSLVAQVMEGVGTPDVIVRAGQSPHGYAMRPSEAAALRDADLIVWMGEDLTPWLQNALGNLAGDARITTLLDVPNTVLRDSRGTATFKLADHEMHEDGHDDHAAVDHEMHEDGHEDHAALDHEMHEDGHDEHAHEDHEMHEDAHDDHAGEGHADHAQNAAHDHGGHDHDGLDPHAWLDPANAMTWLDAIAEELAAIDPANADIYRSNAKAGQADLKALQGALDAQLSPIRGKKFLVFHDAYQYFEKHFALNAAGAVSIGDASEPGPKRLVELRDLVKEHDIHCVFAEPQFNTDVIASVFGDDIRLGTLDPLGMGQEAGIGHYAGTLQAMADEVVACLSVDS